ncbi:MAG TPA: aminobenzoate oxygenase, partial [Actinomycetota bacterium]|nr:aminobenzoate oxygenase [Actinomycetota bacterium]
WRTLGFDADDCIRYVRESETLRQFRSLLFSRIVPTLRDIGMFGPKVRAAFADMGVLGFEQLDVDALMADDEAIADTIDARRRQQVADTVAAGRA